LLPLRIGIGVGLVAGIRQVFIWMPLRKPYEWFTGFSLYAEKSIWLLGCLDTSEGCECASMSDHCSKLGWLCRFTRSSSHWLESKLHYKLPALQESYTVKSPCKSIILAVNLLLRSLGTKCEALAAFLKLLDLLSSQRLK